VLHVAELVRDNRRISGSCSAGSGVIEDHALVAHELGHVKHRDVPRGILWLAIVAPPATLLVQRLTEQIAPRRAGPGPPVLPAAALSIALVSFGTGIVSNVGVAPRGGGGRRLRAPPDPRPEGVISVERKLTTDN